jgi:hypothetical protein
MTGEAARRGSGSLEPEDDNVRGQIRPGLCAVVLALVAAPLNAQELALPGVHIDEISIRLTTGETARGPIRVAPPETGPTREMAPDSRGPLPNVAIIEVPPGMVQRTLHRAFENELAFRASFSGRDARGQYYVTAVRHARVAGFRGGGTTPAVVAVASRDGVGPPVECTAEVCTGPADDFLFLYHCVTGQHTYVPPPGGARQATCTLQR